MNHQQMKTITTNPKAMMDFQLHGKLPKLKDSLSTPLRELLLSMSTSQRSQYKEIKLDPSIGFTRPLTFRNVFQLLRWLGYQQQVVNNQTLPYYGYVIRQFKRKITVEEFEKCCKVTPK